MDELKTDPEVALYLACMDLERRQAAMFGVQVDSERAEQLFSEYMQEAQRKRESRGSAERLRERMIIHDPG